MASAPGRPATEPSPPSPPSQPISPPPSSPQSTAGYGTAIRIEKLAIRGTSGCIKGAVGVGDSLLLIRGRFKDLGLWQPGKGGRVLGRGPDPLLQKREEPFRLAGSSEVQIDDNVLGIVDGPLDAVPEHPGLLPKLGETAERRFPQIEVDDRMFDVQCRHGYSLVNERCSARRYEGRPGRPIPNLWGLRTFPSRVRPTGPYVSCEHGPVSGV